MDKSQAHETKQIWGLCLCLHRVYDALVEKQDLGLYASRWFRELLYQPHLRPHPQLVIAELGERAGAYGAAILPTVHV